MRHRVSHNMGLGSIRVVGLAEARLLAAEAQRQLHDGMDPLDQKRRGTIARNSPTFKVASLRYIDIHKPSWKSPKHIAQWSNSLKAYAWPVLGSVTVDLASREHIVQILEPIWLTKPETASRIRGRMEKIFDWAEAEGYRTGENPARWKGNLDHSLPKRTGKRKNPAFGRNALRGGSSLLCSATKSKWDGRSRASIPDPHGRADQRGSVCDERRTQLSRFSLGGARCQNEGRKGTPSALGAGSC